MNKSKIKIEWFAVFVVMAILIPIFFYAIVGYKECTYEGGNYVKSLFWFTCIK